MSEFNRIIPVVALRGMTILPGMMIHFDVNRKISIEAIEYAMNHDQEVLLVAQKDAETELPTIEDVYTTGTVALIKQMVKLPGNVIRVLVSGIKRAKILELKNNSTFIEMEIEVETEPSSVSESFELAYVKGLKDILDVYFIENPKIGKDIIKNLKKIKKLSDLVDQITGNLPIDFEEKQEILECFDLEERSEKLMIILTNHIEMYRIKKELQAKVKAKVDKNQKEYILREQLKLIREELGEGNTQGEIDQLIDSLSKIQASEVVKEKIGKEIQRFKNIGPSSSESAVQRAYIETLLALPWDKSSNDSKDLKRAEKILNEDHYGLDKVKERILEFLAVRSLTEKGTSPIICLVGPPGTGKTSIARSVAKALNKEYVRISLGGVRDEAEIRGHRRTYVGALPGRLITGLKSAKVKNPLMLLDEIDKVSSDHKGDTAAALLEVLDGEQNSTFTDHYVEMPVDLSEVLFIATANSLQTISRPLLDRMEVIEVTSYTQNEKLHIAKSHLVSKTMNKNGLKAKQLTISDKALQKLISGYTKEAGVRSLERKLSEVCRKAAKEIVIEEKDKVRVTDKNLEKYLGKSRYSYLKANNKDEVGIVRGLAWTSVGGDTLQIEVNVMPGKGRFELTGQLGDVMKESARTAISYVRSVSEVYNISVDYFDKHDIHIHIPEGAVPKDGPSAGITMATAILSAVTNRMVRHDIAMTGEVTLRGRVLAIGGLKEKILAAKVANIKTVLVPAANKKDVEEISAEILDGVEVHFVSGMEEVVQYAIVSKI